MQRPNTMAVLPSKIIKEEDYSAIVSDGDAVLVIKKDGAILPLTIGERRTPPVESEVDEMTDEEIMQFEQSAKLFALVMAASSPQIMTFLMEIASDPDIFDAESIKKLSRQN